MTEDFRIGVILRPHGVKGEMKVHPTTGDPERFRKLKEVQVRTKGKEESYSVASVRFFKDQVLLKLEGINSPEEADAFRKSELFVSRDQAIPLGENEYYVPDLLGSTVSDEEDRVIGTLTDVLTGSANDVYVVTDGNGKEILLPAIRECILSVEPENKKVRVHLMKGLPL